MTAKKGEEEHLKLKDIDKGSEGPSQYYVRTRSIIETSNFKEKILKIATREISLNLNLSKCLMKFSGFLKKLQ